MVKPWKEFQREITRLYISEGLTLDEVKSKMEERYNFMASTRSYRQHFDQWNLEKYNCKRRQQRKLDQRRREGQAPHQSQDHHQKQMVTPMSPPTSPDSAHTVPIGGAESPPRPLIQAAYRPCLNNRGRDDGRPPTSYGPSQYCFDNDSPPHAGHPRYVESEPSRYEYRLPSLSFGPLAPIHGNANWHHRYESNIDSPYCSMGSPVYGPSVGTVMVAGDYRAE